MNKLVYKRIIGLFIFALTFMFGISNVYAATCDEVVTKLNDNDTQLKRYGLSMQYDKGSNKYVVTSNVSSATINAFHGFDSSFKKSDIKFKVAGLYFYEPTGNEKNDLRNENPRAVENISSRINEFKSNGVLSSLNIGHSGEITIKKDVFGARSDSNKIGLAIKLVPDGFNDPELVNSCGKNASFYVVVYTAVETGNQMNAQLFTTDYSAGSSSNYGKIDCTNYASKYDKNSFNYNFCEDKNNALASNSTRKFTIREYKKGNMIKYENNSDSKAFKPNDALAFKCDYNDLVTGVSNSDAEYYTNKSYVYGEGTITIDLENGYRYSGEYTDTKANLDASCELKCEEVVKVEYGPPIASKAGLCFEYKVKVTSRVNCEMSKKPTEPPKQVVCTPTPWCNHQGGYADHQGGPNDDFDQCVVSCDGGKYSDKCVNKCYKQVYGKSIVRQTSGYEIAYDDKVLGTSRKPLDELYEYKYKNGVLIWDVGATGSTVGRYVINSDGSKSKVTIKGGPKQNPPHGGVVATDSYWHKNEAWGYGSSVYTLYDKVGIPLIANCSTTNCWWDLNNSSLCTDKSNLRYLNHPDVYKGTKNEGNSDIEADSEFNKKQYEKLVKQCEAYASCNTTTAEFTISVDYTEKGATKKQTINFPYTSDKKATIKSQDGGASCLPEEKSSIILSSDGCYNCADVNEKKMYMTEWSFPGTWIHNKTGNITYNPDTINTTSWRKIKNKFCLPLNIANTNTKWYNYYQAKINGDDTSYSFNNTEYMNSITCSNGKKLTNTCDYRNTTFTSEDAKDIDYNIKATARKFGMYEWDIDISCFYAVNDLFPKVKESDKCEVTCTSDTKDSKDSKMRVRSVDLTNLFPDKDGNKLTDSSETGRTPGYNWTSFANQTKKDEEYTSLPSNYAKWVQAKGTSVYSDEYLDYEVNLTKEIINQLKKEVNSGMNKKYTNWQGDTEINSVTNYQSPLFRNGGILSKNSKYPVGNAITCNNMKNYASTECEDFSGEVK